MCVCVSYAAESLPSQQTQLQSRKWMKLLDFKRETKANRAGPNATDDLLICTELLKQPTSPVLDHNASYEPLTWSQAHTGTLNIVISSWQPPPIYMEAEKCPVG